MPRYNTFSDDLYINMHLNTEMDLPQNRESVLHYFEQVRRRYPGMRNFYNRERQELVLEEDKDSGSYRWASVEPRRVCSGYVNPPSADEAVRQHVHVLELAPCALSLSPLDCESLNMMYGFDYTYRGNHSQLLVDVLGLIPPFERMAQIPGASMLSYEPAIQMALDEECRYQCRISFETRTSAYHVRTGDFPEDQLSVYLTVRRYGSLEGSETYADAMTELARVSREIVEGYMVDGILRPLQEAIAIS
ncbi:MAG: hypothetical protein FJ297_17720 [Planctomycetes bacterium]|nr:hypothetical protein [Planctomycetota bacterium]